MSLGRAPFRPDIEGLRGGAILLVVLFHAGVSAFAGGFVGVDVFFVLSGYFITALLAREVDECGGVDLDAFLARRTLRLLPLLLVVLAATLLAVMTLYAPIDRVPAALAARAAALSAGNIEFARGSVDYFSSAENPLLHSWSLGVEQQFYLVWPLLFLLAASVREWRGIGAPATSGAMLPWVAGIGLVSFGASVWLTSAAQPWAFYGMPTRLWEFALGGGLALARPVAARWSPRACTALQGVGLAGIAVAVALYDRVTPYPGVAALLPALATCAVIAGGAGSSGGVVERLLATPPLRWLGRMSYGWYLWHWPLMGLGAVLLPSIGPAGRLLLGGVALALAWLTHRVVEQPAREGVPARQPASRVLVVASAAALMAALCAHLALRAAERRVASGPQRAYAAARADRIPHGCWATTVDRAPAWCQFGDRSSSITLVLFGDSHAEHWLGALDRAGRERGWKVLVTVKGGCPVADMPGTNTVRRRRHYAECTRYREATMQRIIAMRPAAVILGSWDHYIPVRGAPDRWQVTPAMWQEGLRRTYARLGAAGVPTIVLRDVPRTPFDTPACLSRREARLPLARSCTYDLARALSPAAVRAQDAALRGLPARVIDMNDRICPGGRCEVVRNGAVVFTDDNHLTASFSRTLGPALGARISAILARGG